MSDFETREYPEGPYLVSVFVDGFHDGVLMNEEYELESMLNQWSENGFELHSINVTEYGRSREYFHEDGQGVMRYRYVVIGRRPE